MFSLRADDEVTLELAELHHAEEVYELVDRNREHLDPWMPWTGATRSSADTLAFLTFVRGEYAARRQLHCNLRFNGTMVGAMGLPVMDLANRTAEIGYWIDAGHAGRGIVTRATSALTTAAFAEWGFLRVAILADVENVRSRAVPERLGFAFEGVLRAHKRIHDRNVDHAVYSMLAEDWRAGTLRPSDAGGM